MDLSLGIKNNNFKSLEALCSINLFKQIRHYRYITYLHNIIRHNIILHNIIKNNHY